LSFRSAGPEAGTSWTSISRQRSLVDAFPDSEADPIRAWLRSGGPGKGRTETQGREAVILIQNPAVKTNLSPEDLPLRFLYEDSIHRPLWKNRPGWSSTPRRECAGNLVNALLST